MGLMNKQEYTQACLFRVREALETTQAWWNNSPTISERKIETTMAMLKDIVHELEYFQRKLSGEFTDDD
ncbi:MAG: hypothetical protein GX020_04755 [Firmicutes bacterium]|nr:hypothetical protein [Bacillota bacterium]